MIDTPRHSTRVTLTLTVGGSAYDIAQVASDYVIFRDPVDLPPCFGRLSMVVDDDERVESISLPDGAGAHSLRVRIESK